MLDGLEEHTFRYNLVCWMIFPLQIENVSFHAMR